MTRKLIIPKKKTSLTMEFSTFAKVEEAARELNKSNSEIMEMSMLAGLEAIKLALNPKNSIFLKEIGEKYSNELSLESK